MRLIVSVGCENPAHLQMTRKFKETGNKVFVAPLNVLEFPLLTIVVPYHREDPDFPIDALIAYLLHECAGDLALCHKFDDAAKCLLTKGGFPSEFRRKEIRAWVDQSTETGRTVANIGPCWNELESATDAKRAQDFLCEWRGGQSDKPLGHI